MAAREKELKRFVKTALKAGIAEGDVEALRSLARLDQAADDPHSAWFLSVREVLGEPVAEVAVLHGNALVLSSVGEGTPWRAVHPLGMMVEARWFAPDEEGEQSMKLRIGKSTHVLREGLDDLFTTGLRYFADAVLDRMIG